MDAAIPGIRAEQFAKVSLTHERRGHGLSLRIGGALPNPVLIDEPKDLVAELRPDFGNRHRAARGKSEIVVAEGSGEVGGRAEVASPGVGVQVRVAEIFVEAAVKVCGAAFGDDADLAAGSVAIFGLIIRR